MSDDVYQAVLRHLLIAVDVVKLSPSRVGVMASPTVVDMPMQLVDVLMAMDEEST